MYEEELVFALFVQQGAICYTQVNGIVRLALGHLCGLAPNKHVLITMKSQIQMELFAVR